MPFLTILSDSSISFIDYPFEFFSIPVQMEKSPEIETYNCEANLKYNPVDTSYCK